MINYSQLAEQFEEWIRGGEVERLHTELDELNLKLESIPRGLKVRFSTLFRRAGLTSRALALLAPLVRGKVAGESATDVEIIEYCNCLKFLGLANEAFNRLIAIDSEKTPEVLFNIAFYHMGRWDYQAAIAPLAKYAALDGLDPYQKTLMELNLIDCYVEVGDLERAKKELPQIVQLCKDNQWQKILINGLQLEADIAIQEQSPSAAQVALDKARDISQSELMIDVFFLKIREAIVESMIKADVAPLQEFRKQAEKREHWETVRHTDFHILKLSYNEDLHDFLHHGTPHFGFRQKLQRQFPPPRPHYLLNGSHPRQFDLHAGSENGKPLLKQGQAVHKLLNAIVSDFYRPSDVGTLFSYVFRGEDYDAENSQNRIHQVLLRTRDWLKSQEIPLAIREESGVYRFEFLGPYTLRKTAEEQPLSKATVLAEKLRQAVDGEFSSKQANDILQLSRTEGFRFLKSCENLGLIEKKGGGRYTRYVFIKR